MESGTPSDSQNPPPIQTGRLGSPPSNTIQTVSPIEGNAGIPEEVGGMPLLAQEAVPPATDGTRTWSRDLPSGSWVLTQIPA